MARADMAVGNEVFNDGSLGGMSGNLAQAQATLDMIQGSKTASVVLSGDRFIGSGNSVGAGQEQGRQL